MLLLLLTDVLVIAAGTAAGWLLDGVVDSRPLLTLFGFLLGLTIALVTTWSRLRHSSESTKP